MTGKQAQNGTGGDEKQYWKCPCPRSKTGQWTVAPRPGTTLANPVCPLCRGPFINKLYLCDASGKALTKAGQQISGEQRQKRQGRNRAKKERRKKRKEEASEEDWAAMGFDDWEDDDDIPSEPDEGDVKKELAKMTTYARKVNARTIRLGGEAMLKVEEEPAEMAVDEAEDVALAERKKQLLANLK